MPRIAHVHVAHSSSSSSPIYSCIFERSVNSAVILSLPPAPGNLFISQSVKHSNSKQKPPQVVSKSETLSVLSLSLSLSMEAMKPLMKLCIAKLKQGTLLWLEGFKEACCLHRVVILCLRSLLSLKFVFFLSFKYSITVYGFVSFYFWKAKVWWQVEKAFDQNRAMFSTEWFYFLRKVNFFESLYIL